MIPEEPTQVETVGDGTARVSWAVALQDEGFLAAVGVVSQAVEAALAEHARVEALVPVDDETAQRVATWSGLRREGVMRRVSIAW